MAPKPQLTHFLCLPLVSVSSRLHLVNSLREFKSDVFGSEPASPDAQKTSNSSLSQTPVEAQDRVVRPVGSLHLTLGVMSLKDQETIESAIALLNTLDVRRLLSDAARDAEETEDAPSQETQEPGAVAGNAVSRQSTEPLRLSLVGLEAMHSRAKTSVLYATPKDPTRRLHPFCVSLQAAFKQAGLLVPDDRPLKLHATIVNTIYTSRMRKRRGSSLRFDATSLLTKYEGFEWASDLVLDRIAVCKMGASKVVGVEGDVIDEVYEEIAVRAMP